MDVLSVLLGHLDAWWVYPAAGLSVALSGIFPPMPSTTLFVALGSLSVSTGQLDPYLLGLAMVAGALAGDVAGYLLARYAGLAGFRLFQRPGWRATLRATGRRLERHGLVLVTTSRFIPLGRLTANVAAGLVPLAPGRFCALSAGAAVLWASYSVGVGAASGAWEGLRTEIAILLAIAAALVLGRVFSGLAVWWQNRA